MTAANWRAQAACRGTNTDLFDLAIATDEEQTYALGLCAWCPVREPCLEDAKAMGDRGVIRGGVRLGNNRSSTTRVCEPCGSTFVTRSNSPARFCSQPCRNSQIDFSAMAKLAREAEGTVVEKCRLCETEFTRARFSRSRYCSNICRKRRNALAAREKREPAPLLTRPCRLESCDNTVTSRLANQAYCSDSCRTKQKRAADAGKKRQARRRRRNAASVTLRRKVVNNGTQTNRGEGSSSAA